MATRVQLRRGTASQWTTSNPVLAGGEAGVETDTGLVKFGNGTDAWTALPYTGDSRYVQSSLIQAGYVSTFESTTSGVWVDLATAGPQITIDVGASGKVLVFLSAWLRNTNTSLAYARMTFQATGANSITASDDYSIATQIASNAYFAIGHSIILTGLIAGSTTFAAKYTSTDGTTAWFGRRRLAAIPL